jgi:hypothetical protein
VQEGNLVVGRDKSRPTGIKTILLPNRFDRNRAHLVIYNWDKAKKVEVKAKPFLKNGDSFRLIDPQDLFGNPVAQGKCQGDVIHIPMKGEFGVFIVLRNSQI